MRLPQRPLTVDALQERLDAGELHERHDLEFKQDFPPKSERLAKTLAALAVDGGVLVIGVSDGSWKVSPIQLAGARERIESIAHDAVDPSVEIVPYAIATEPGYGVVWVEVPQSPKMAH